MNCSLCAEPADLKIILELIALSPAGERFVVPQADTFFCAACAESTHLKAQEMAKQINQRLQ